MSHSIFEGIVRFDDAEHDDGERLSSLFARVVASNVAHIADSSGQVLVAMPPCADGEGISRPCSLTVPTVLAQFGPLHLRTIGGGSYPVRFRLRARLTASGSVPLTLALHTPDANPISFVGGVFAAGQAETFTCSSATSSWLSPAGDNLLSLPGTVADLRDRAGTRTQITSGVATSVPVREALLSVVMGSAAAVRSVELTGLYAAEFIGA